MSARWNELRLRFGSRNERKLPPLPEGLVYAPGVLRRPWLIIRSGEIEGFALSRSDVIHHNQVFEASESVAAHFVQLDDLYGEPWERPEIGTNDLSGALGGATAEAVKEALENLAPVAKTVVDSALSTSPVGVGALDELRDLRRVSPVPIWFRTDTHECQTHWFTSGEVVYSAVTDPSQVPLHWHFDPGRAGNFAPGLPLVSTELTPENCLLGIAPAGGVLLDPNLVTPKPVQNNTRTLIDPISHEDFSPAPDGQPPRIYDDLISPLVPPPLFVLMGGQALLVSHIGLHEIHSTGEFTDLDSRVLADRLVEDPAWCEAALTIGDALLGRDKGAFGLMWRCKTVAGQSVKVGKRVTGTSFRQLGFESHPEGIDQDYRILPPEERWVWRRGPIAPPTRKKMVDERAWRAVGVGRFDETPRVLVVADPWADELQISQQIGLLRPKVVIGPDVPSWRSFAEQYSSGIPPQESGPPLRLDHYRWKRVERGSVTASAFGATFCSEPNVEPDHIEAAISYAASVGLGTPNILSLAGDPLLQSRLQEFLPERSLDLIDRRSTDAKVSELEPYWDAWAERGSCLFYEEVTE